jgi:hypothetical protein
MELYMTKLYTKDGSFPNTLPYRIKLSDGRTRTGQSTFTEEEIADAGYVLVTEPKPSHNPWEEVEWDGSSWIVKDRDVMEMLSEKQRFIQQLLQNQLASVKYAYLSTGQIVPVDTRTSTDIQNLSGVVQKATIKELRGQTDQFLYFKGADNIVYQLTPAEAIQMGENVFDNIEQIYQECWIKKYMLGTLTTAEQIFNFDHTWVKPPPIVPDDFPVANTEIIEEPS